MRSSPRATGTAMSDHLRFRSAAGFRQAVDDRLKTLAKDLGSPTTLGLLRRRFLHERFLARVFSGPDEHWALKGGVGMLVRVPRSPGTAETSICSTCPPMSTRRSPNCGRSRDSTWATSCGSRSANRSG